MGMAFDRIKSGAEDISLTGGADSAIAFHPFADFEGCGMLSMRNDAPARASRPFDRNRDGGLASEGAGICLFEELRHARARGATIYAEVVGFGSALDPAGGEHGSGFVASMGEALENAAALSRRIDYVNAHGPSDKEMDRVETEAIKTTFGNHAKSLMISSIKGVTGNPLAAGGALQAIASALTLHQSTIHPTANYEFPDPKCDLDYVPNKARRIAIEQVVVNSHGVGGSNCSLVLRRFRA